MFKKILALTLSVLILTALAAGCSGGKLIVATSPDFPPFEYIKDNQVAGIDIEIAQKLAEKMGRELQIDQLDFDGVLAAVSAGRCDLGMSAISATPDRMDSMDFSDPYYETNVRIVVAADNADVTDLASLSGKSVGVQLGTVADTAVTEAGNITVERYDNDATSIQNVLAGRLDAAVLDEAPAKVFVQQNEGNLKLLDTLVSEGDFYVIATKKGNTALLAEVNKALAEMRESGEFDAILSKY